ncbi:MAG: hypothetical protein ACN4GF_09780 [Lentimonas sp.]
MDVDARISKAWRKRMLFLLFMISGIGAWFLSDGYIYWPNEAERYAEYTEIKGNLIEEGKSVDEESTFLKLAWERHARKAGYKSKAPKERTDAGIREQRNIGWVMIIGSTFYALWIAWNHTRRVRAEGETVIGASGERVELDSIVAIDRKKWNNKGIAYAIYEDNGKQRRLTLDDHKFEGCEAIILEAESRIKARKEA